MPEPLVTACHEIQFKDYSSALAFLSGFKCAVTHSYSVPFLPLYFHRQVTKIIRPGHARGPGPATALIIIPGPAVGIPLGMSGSG